MKEVYRRLGRVVVKSAVKNEESMGALLRILSPPSPNRVGIFRRGNISS